MIDIQKMIQMKELGMSASEISAIVTAELSAGKTVSTSKSGGTKIVPLEAVDMSASVANSLKLFDGILDAKFTEWDNKLCVANKGTGGKQLKWNAMFQPLSNYEGKVIPAEVIANAQTAMAAHEEHITILESVIGWAKGLNPVQPPAPKEGKGKVSKKKD